MAGQKLPLFPFWFNATDIELWESSIEPKMCGAPEKWSGMSLEGLALEQLSKQRGTRRETGSLLLAARLCFGPASDNMGGTLTGAEHARTFTRSPCRGKRRAEAERSLLPSNHHQSYPARRTVSGSLSCHHPFEPLHLNLLSPDHRTHIPRVQEEW